MYVYVIHYRGGSPRGTRRWLVGQEFISSKISLLQNILLLLTIDVTHLKLVYLNAKFVSLLGSLFSPQTSYTTFIGASKKYLCMCVCHSYVDREMSLESVSFIRFPSFGPRICGLKKDIWRRSSCIDLNWGTFPHTHNLHIECTMHVSVVFIPF